ncbi:long-chain-fatty-acid--CoA ligase [Acidimicrobiaceae bacterium USS-CC1]|uniref:Long-chain-fatty-acid--CoA ligase n=1 Tax=Acidiferrimicrobium australe TaxID=2664430 RepID=A0ABW9QTW4_9ACTN|nr:long-chain-fatty-acid--CoA ligase [Acidiferrimicrobium australe]
MQGLMQEAPMTLAGVFRRAERFWPTKRIVTAGRDGLTRTDVGSWAERTRRLGGALDRLGVSADGRVGTFAWNTARHLELYFAAPCTGRVLHTLNVRLFPDQLTYIVNHADDEVIFADRSLLGLLWPLVGEMPKVRHVVVMDDGAGEVPDDPRILDYEELLASAPSAAFDAVDDERRAAAMCYTSGTTGHPKGVVYTHRSVVLHSIAAMLADSLAVSEADTVLPVVPMFHVNAWGLCQAALMAGSDLVFPGSDLRPAAIADLLVGERVTLAAGVPTIWMGVLGCLEGRDTSALTRIVCGGSAVPKALSEAYRRRIGLPILQAWGMTETSPLASIARVRSELADRDDDELAEVRATQGLPVPLVELRITDPATGEEQPWDGKASGEIQVHGPWVASSYYDDPRSPDSFAPDGWLRTGDVATVSPEGYIRIVDRTKDVIKSGGEWISSVDLENEIMGHPAVAEAAVIAVPSERWMERPVACVVRRPEAALSEEELLAWLAPRVAKWWLPDQVLFIDEVPKTSVGKFSKRQLRDRFADLRLP